MDDPGVFVGIILVVVTPIHMEAGGIQVCHCHSSAPEAEALGGPPGDQPVELGEPEGVERISSALGKTSSFRCSGLTPAPTSRSVGSLRKNSGIRYKRLLAKPKPFKTIA
jgi:hypothetical protein